MSVASWGLPVATVAPMAGPSSQPAATHTLSHPLTQLNIAPVVVTEEPNGRCGRESSIMGTPPVTVDPIANQHQHQIKLGQLGLFKVKPYG